MSDVETYDFEDDAEDYEEEVEDFEEVDDADFDDEDADDEDIDVDDDDGNESEPAPRRRGRKPGPVIKHPVPEGAETIADFVVRVNYYADSDDESHEPFNHTITSQTIYNAISNDKSDFPSIVHTDGRKLVSIKDGLRWILSLDEKLASRKAERVQRKVQQTESRLRSLTKAAHALANEIRKSA